MDGAGVSKIEKDNHQSRHRKKKTKTRAPKGLQVKQRDGNWHIIGSIVVGGRTIRIRKSTGLPATLENFEAADAIKDQIKSNTRDEIIYGKKAEKLLPEAAVQYLKQRDLRRQDRSIILEITMNLCVDWDENEELKEKLIDSSKPVNERLAHFISLAQQHNLPFRTLRKIEAHEWQDYIDERNRKNTPQTRQRYINIVKPFIKWCFKKKWMDELPEITRSKSVLNKAVIARRRVSEITPELIEMMINHATWHLKPQIAVEWSTGSRVSSVLCQVRRCDVKLDKGKEEITFGNTKNGDPVTSALHPWSAKVIREYIKQVDEKLHSIGQKMNPEDQLFRDWRGRPYKYNKDKGGASNRTAFNTMKRRVIKKLIAQGRHNEADLISQFTQHWFRHKLATTLSKNGADIRTIMEQGCWKTPEMVVHYIHDVPEKRRALVASMEAPDTFLTREENQQILSSVRD